MRLIASLTTTPNRATQKDLKECIERLRTCDVIDLIILNVPKVMKRTGKPYDIEAIRSMVQGPKLLMNVVDEDDGPITKLSATLDLVPNTDDDVYLLILDDDVLYNHDVMRERVAKHLQKNRDGATSLFGRRIDTEPVMEGPSDVLEGVVTIMVRRNLMPKNRQELLNFIQEYFPNDPEIFLTDDLIISAWFSLNDIPKTVYRMHINDKFLADGDQDALFLTNFQYRNKANFTRYKHYFGPRCHNRALLLWILLVIFAIFLVCVM